MNFFVILYLTDIPDYLFYSWIKSGKPGDFLYYLP